MTLEFKDDQTYLEDEWTVGKRVWAVIFIILLVVGFCVLLSEGL